MPAKNPRPRPPRQPSYRLHKARGCAVVTINGKNHYLGKHGSPESHEKYARLVAQWQANGKELTVFAADEEKSDLSVSGSLLKYLAHAEGHYKSYGTQHQGEISNLRHAVKLLRILHGRTHPREFLRETQAPGAMFASLNSRFRGRSKSRIRNRIDVPQKWKLLMGSSIGPQSSLNASEDGSGRGSPLPP